MKEDKSVGILDLICLSKCNLLTDDVGVNI